MLLIKFIIVSLLYHMCCGSAIAGAQSNIQDNKKETKSTMKQSNIYNIKRLNAVTKETLIERNKQRPQNKQEQKKHQTELKSNDHLFEGVTATAASLKQSINPKKYKNLTKSSHKLNKKMLKSNLSMPALPTYTYTFSVFLGETLYEIADYFSKNRLGYLLEDDHVSFPFSSNGRPGRIYHWNLPVLKKMLQDKQRYPTATNTSPKKAEKLIDIKNIPTWSKPWENDSIEKSYGHDATTNYKKPLKRKSPTYYAPANAVNKNSFNKYFSGNGKPKGFYVIKENQKKPSYYKNIIV
uniref:LysM domain-containing protein n=1 Tax=Glossina palpalis gambiensis TaxID=67801 RepID=A0A1B0BUY5_9MUSC